jgi:hypothetical protein
MESISKQKATDKYRLSEKGKETRKRYRQSQAGKQSSKKTYTSPQGKLWVKKAGDQYRQTNHGRAVILLCDARKRARQQNLPFALTVEWIEEKLKFGVCEQTGDAFNLTLFKNSHRNMFAPSLDQIIPAGGYTPENTQIVCWWWNSFKHNRTDEEAWQHFQILHNRQSLSS